MPFRRASAAGSSAWGNSKSEGVPGARAVLARSTSVRGRRPRFHRRFLVEAAAIPQLSLAPDDDTDAPLEMPLLRMNGNGASYPQRHAALA